MRNLALRLSDQDKSLDSSQIEETKSNVSHQHVDRVEKLPRFANIADDGAGSVASPAFQALSQQQYEQSLFELSNRACTSPKQLPQAQPLSSNSDKNGPAE